MDGSVLDAIARAIARPDTRRRLLRLLTGLPLANWLAIHAGESNTAARGRR